VIPEDVRRFAEDPAAWGDIPRESGLTRVLTEQYCLILGPVLSFTLVSRLRVKPSEVASVLADVRTHVATHDHREAAWWVGSSATPPDLVDRLLAHGLVPAERPGWEAHATSMALADAPADAPPGIEARRVAGLDEFRRAAAVSHSVFESSDEDRREWDAIAEQRFTAERAGHGPRSYIAYMDGHPVGAALGWVSLNCPAVLMIGGSVLPDARGRGVYRALVRARWDDAVSAGIPALCTHAGHMSRPILERLGFRPVAEQEVLLDPTTC
jgi:GNAT superfamily N-acetyltransferase